ncbi:MAG: tyrosine-type recombinase/integrase [Spirochaetales bacterium]|nr:tyrosine-type recombinase/integrase [Spirochaetales bacterium]
MNEITANTETARALAFMAGLKDNYAFARRDFIRYTGGRPLTIETVKDYFRELNESTMAASTIRVKRAGVKAALRRLAAAESFESWAKLERALDRLDREPETKAPKINQAGVDEDRIISEKEYHELVAGARSERQRLFIRFLYGTGARVSEALGVLKKDVRRSGNWYKIKIVGKGRKERILIVPVELVEDIRAVCTVEESQYLFHTTTGRAYSRCYVSGQIKKLGRDILGKRISAHTMRHSFATRQIRRTNKIKGVSTYLGHSSSSITLDMYCHETLTRKELFTAFTA